MIVGSGTFLPISEGKKRLESWWKVVGLVELCFIVMWD